MAESIFAISDPGIMPHTLKTALLVEDEPAQTIALELMLQDYGIPEILAAPDAETALSIALAHRIDLLICDLNLPGKDGMSLLREISKLPDQPAVVVLSAFDSSLLRAVSRVAADLNLRLLGAISKPLTTEMLDTLLQRIPLVTPRSVSIPNAALDVPDALLVQALEQQWFEPYYEARVSRETGLVEGVEILARLCVPGGPVITPGRFIYRLEAMGRIDEMTWQIADRAFEFVGRCCRNGLPLTVSLNLSPMMLGDDRLITQLTALVRTHGLERRSVTLEITESAAIESTVDMLERLVHIRLREFGLSIDDFGTGFSSLAQLSKLPFTEMKIDHSFTSQALREPKARVVVESSIDLARRLGIRVCVEGVESHEVFRLIHDLQVDALQGYFFHRPMPAAQFEAWARSWNQHTTIAGLYSGAQASTA